MKSLTERALAWMRKGMETTEGPKHPTQTAIEMYEAGWSDGYIAAMNRAQEMLIEIVRGKGPILPSSIVVQFIDAVSLEVK